MMKARHGKKARLAAAIAGAIFASLAIACSADRGPAASSGSPPSPDGGTTEDDFISVFSAISVMVLDDTRLMNQIAISASVDDQARIGSHDIVRRIQDDLKNQLEVLEQLEPVSQTVDEAHESAKAAMMKYIEAAGLLLPPQGSDGEPFEFSGYQTLMAEAGKAFHGAGFALPTGSATDGEGVP